MSSEDRIFERALELHRQGRFDEAEAGYRAVLVDAPSHFDALHLLGVTLYQKGEDRLAVELIGRAIALKPDVAAAHSNLGNALRRLKRNAEALACYDRAIALEPAYAEAFNNRGNALAELGRAGDALISFDRALSLKPDYAEALKNRAGPLLLLKRADEALLSLERALALRPEDWTAWYNRGNVLSDLKRHADALESYDRALAFKPDYAQALNNRGNVLRELKRPSDALLSFDAALKAWPDYAEAFSNRGNALIDLGRPKDALADYDRVLRLAPDYAEAWNNRGDALRDLHRFEDAILSYDRALRLMPGFAEALDNRGMALMSLRRFGEAAQSFARVLEGAPRDYTLGYMLHARLQACDWSSYDALTSRVAQGVARGEKVDVPFSFLAHSTDPAAQLACAKIYTADKHPPEAAVWRGDRYDHKRIRLAYLSSDFQNHPVSFLIAELIELHDRSKFEVFGFAFGPDRKGEMRERIERAFDRFIDVQEKTDDEVAALLRELEIDIAIDLNGFTQGYRAGIFARRGAPVQVNYLGYPGTMGADYIDYVIADEHIVPKGHERFYAEKIVRLPESYQANDRKRRMAAHTPTRAELGLAEGFVFCCFNNNYKITPEMFALWMRLLKRIEGSVLWLLENNLDASRNLKAAAARFGMADRLVFAPRVAPADYLARFRLADLFLDTLPYNAHTTASDALWAGLPLITSTGETFASRVAGSLLHAVGLPGLIAPDLAAYEALAVDLATRPGRLAEIRSALEQNREGYPLFDTDRFRRHIEEAYRTMHERHACGLDPASFDVGPVPT
jgi:predicted O-linked N-acetylglucosamine transferase (SPINDLY family)